MQLWKLDQFVQMVRRNNFCNAQCVRLLLYSILVDFFYFCLLRFPLFWSTYFHYWNNQEHGSLTLNYDESHYRVTFKLSSLLELPCCDSISSSIDYLFFYQEICPISHHQLIQLHSWYCLIYFEYYYVFLNYFLF